MKPQGKPKEPLTTEEQAQIAALSAGGWSANKVSKHIGRSRHTVQKYLDTPEAAAIVRDERQELAALYREKARACVVAIDAEKIAKSSALQLATASGICTDKAALLTGEPTANLSVTVLWQLVQAVREQRDAEDARFRALPAKTQ